MTPMRKLLSRGAALAALALLFLVQSGGSAMACAVCYGDTSGSRMGQAASLGIAAMVVIVFAMLGTLIGCGFYLNYRAKHPLPDYNSLLTEVDGPAHPGTAS